jgi:hypothetical protein
MTRRERLQATIRGQPVDRPAVSFYEITGFDERGDNPDPFNIYNDPSWAPVLELARERSDCIVRRGVPFRDEAPDPRQPYLTQERWTEGGNRYDRQTWRVGGRTLTAVNRRDPAVNTVWHVEHLLKDADDARAWLELPARSVSGTPEVRVVTQVEEALGEAGICMIDIADPMCQVAAMFHMSDYTVLALTEPELFQALLERQAEWILPRTEAIAKALPGRLWRIVGPEYAGPPLMPPRMFGDLVLRYLTPMVESIQRYGGFARVHCHGRLKAILDGIASTGCVGLDPIEPPPQGDVSLRYVQERYGQQMVLFGNLEASDLENLSEADFGRKIDLALNEGTAGQGRGFVLMPSACPYGRHLTEQARRNYELMIATVERRYGC